MNSSLAPLALLAASLLLPACGPSLASLHDRAAVGQVQPDAPLHARHAITIDAPIETVWARLTDVASWPTWQPGVRRVEPPASLAPGASFRWDNGGTAITSTLAVVRPNELLGWTGQASTARAIHLCRLSEPTPGQTLVEADETMDGFLLTWFYGQPDLDRGMVAWLDGLKAASEAPALPRPPTAAR